MQLLGAAGDGPALVSSFLNLFKEGAQSSACGLVGAVCRVSRVDSEPVAVSSSSNSGSTFLRISVEDWRVQGPPSGSFGLPDQQHQIGNKSSSLLRQQEPSPVDHPVAAAAAAAAGRQGGQRHLLGPAFIIGALQTFADTSILGVRSFRVVEGDKNAAAGVAGSSTGPRGHQSGGDTIVEVEVDDPSIGPPPELGLQHNGLPWPDLEADFHLLNEQYKVGGT